MIRPIVQGRVYRTLSIQYLQYDLFVAKNLTSTGQKYSGSSNYPQR
jgi:hypothetical protein